MISDKDLDNAIISFYQGGGINPKVIRLALEELKERRECELRPATKFINATFQEQLDHVKSEIREIEEAENNPVGTYDYYALLDEITDAQHSLQTLKAIAGATKEDDMGSHRRVTGKNMKRGYYDE